MTTREMVYAVLIGLGVIIPMYFMKLALNLYERLTSNLLKN